jgi:preprotein translocase subunit SecF
LNQVKKAVSDSGIGISTVQKVGETNFTIKTPELPDNLKNELDQKLKIGNQYSFSEVKLKTISPSVSSEFVNKSI